MVDRLVKATGVPVAATCPAAVLALAALGVTRIALVDPPWFDVVNELGAEYFRGQGLDVVYAASAGLPADPGRIDPAGVVAWVARQVPDEAEAIYFGGNGFRV